MDTRLLNKTFKRFPEYDNQRMKFVVDNGCYAAVAVSDKELRNQPSLSYIKALLAVKNKAALAVLRDGAWDSIAQKI